MIEVRWHGRGGQGSFTAARLLGMAAALFENKYALAFPSFGPERRGAPVLGFTKIDDIKITDRSEVQACDYVIILDETLINGTTSRGLKEDALILINTPDRGRYDSSFPGHTVVTVDATSIALDILKRPITNTAMLGALAALSDVVSMDALIKAIEKEMKPTLVEKNVSVIKRAYETALGERQ